jgi:L-rhamnose mutarotase
VRYIVKEADETREITTRAEKRVVPLRTAEKEATPPMLLRHAFRMKLKPGFKGRHDQIWPELSRVLTRAGISDYSIYLDEEMDTLFAFQKLAPGHTAADLPNHPVVRKWWRYMSDIMECENDSTPVAVSLDEVFHME